jgi:hypothetical protein
MNAKNGGLNPHTGVYHNIKKMVKGFCLIGVSVK